MCSAFCSLRVLSRICRIFLSKSIPLRERCVKGFAASRLRRHLTRQECGKVVAPGYRTHRGGILAQNGIRSAANTASIACLCSATLPMYSHHQKAIEQALKMGSVRTRAEARFDVVQFLRPRPLARDFHRGEGSLPTLWSSDDISTREASDAVTARTSSASIPGYSVSSNSSRSTLLSSCSGRSRQSLQCAFPNSW